ncbi:MAG: hypothetical protein FWD25_00425 [Clostridia bacterium]|nr:hypothetical protein [Clostridia bacterium]
MNRIKTWCSILLCVLLICCAAPTVALSAAAESGNADLFTREVDGSSSEYVNSVVAVQDTLYMLGNALFSYRPGNAEPQQLLTSEQIWDSETIYQPQLLIGGEDTLFALDTTHGMLGMWDGRRFDWIQQLDWANMTREVDEWTESRSVQSPIMADGWLYMLVMRNFDAWDDFALHRYDIATGEFTILSTQDVLSIASCAPGKLVALRRDRVEWKPSIVVVDGVTGAVERTLFEADGYYGMLGGLACDIETGAVYVAKGNMVVTAENGALGEPVAYINADASERYPGVLLSTGHYAVYTYNGLFVRSLDPQHRPSTVLRLAGGYMDDATSAFARANPDVALQTTDDFMFTSQQVIEALLSQEDNVDVFRVFSIAGFKGLRDKGYLADLSASPALVAAVEAMYPAVGDAVLVDGKLYGLPSDLSLDLWQVEVDALEQLGLGGMPATMLDFLDVIERWFDEDMADDHPEWTLFDQWVNKEQILYQLVMSYIGRYEQPHEPLQFDTPQLRAVLERWEQLPDFGQSFDGGGTVVRSFSSSDDAIPLFNLSAYPFNRFYRGNADSKPQMAPPPAFIQGEAPMVLCHLTVYALNPNSTQEEVALHYLEYQAEHGDPRSRYMLRPDLSEPVPESYAIESKRTAEQYLAEALEKLDKADEADIKDIEAEIESYQAWLDDIERYYWMIPAEALAEYRALAPYFVLSIDSVMLNYDAGSVEELFSDLQRYAQGQMRLDEMLRELDKKSRMIFLEGQ